MPALSQARAVTLRHRETAQADTDLAFFDGPLGRLALWLDHPLAWQYQNIRGVLNDYQSGRELDTSVPWLLEEAAAVRLRARQVLLTRGAVAAVVAGAVGYGIYRWGR